MRQDALLDPDLAEPARRLIAQARLLAEREPELYRAAVRGRGELTRFFAAELGWTLDVYEPADMVRLHKRRHDVPGERGPRLRRSGRGQTVAPRLVLIVAALVCEQLWRRPRMTLNDLLQAVAQVCAADSEQGLLPQFAVVPGDGVSKREAHANRQSLVDALRLLEADGTVSVEGGLDQAAADGTGDGVVAASRDRLAAKFSSLSPSLLKLSQLPPQQHAMALTADTADVDSEPPSIDPSLPTPDGRGGRDDTTHRRQQAIRRLVDDPGTDPRCDDYLQTSPGRNRALNVLHALGLVGVVRRDWWQVTDPSGLGSALDFPTGRRNERQAALALLEYLSRRALTDDGHERPIEIGEAVRLFEQVRVRVPRWAAAYAQLSLLAEAAAGELADAGFLIRVAPIDGTSEGDNDNESRWLPTPAVRMWRIKLNAHSPDSSEELTGKTVAPAPLLLFDNSEGAH
ncbi:DUF2398 family protein [Nocardia sp. NPDC005978]|uniref:DUF2398 family protein n=1 Tax=Nocardia sp. NPDC005978 TaxID=3156725 RepID=UPI00339E203E